MSALTLQKRLSSAMTLGSSKPSSFTGGGSTNRAESKFAMDPSITSDETGTISANKATKFMQEYASKLTEVNPDTRKLDGEIASGDGITTVESEGAPNVTAEVTAEFEETILNLQAVAEDEVQKQNIPRKYRDHVKKYFDSLRN